MIMKNKILKLIIICLSVFAVFAAIVMVLFYSMSNDPIDQISMTYLWNDSHIEDKYGEIIHIGRYAFGARKKGESEIKSPYVVETKTGRITVYVTLEKHDEEWEASSYEVIEERLNER